MKRKTILAIYIISLSILILCLGVALIMIFVYPSSLVCLFPASLILLITIAIAVGNIIHLVDIADYENRVKKSIGITYTKLQITDSCNIPLCIKLALEGNNITFYGKHVTTRNGDLMVYVIAKKDDEFFAEEILTEKGPMFLTCKEFLNTFEV